MEDRYDCGDYFVNFIHTKPPIVQAIHKPAANNTGYDFMFSTSDVPETKAKAGKK
jgi:hypothetical protein